MIERRCKSEGVTDPTNLSCPTMEYSELQEELKRRAIKHTQRDKERRLSDDRDDYHNGALFGLDPTVAPDENDPRWEVRVVPEEDYLEEPRLAGSAWKHTERRHSGDNR